MYRTSLWLSILSLSLLPALAPSAGAQAPSYRFSPSGAEFMQGGSSNTVPWWSTAGTYQQIHDYAEMVAVAGGKPGIIMNGLGFRPATTQTLSGRSWDLRLSLGHSPNPSASASTHFACWASVPCSSINSRPTLLPTMECSF